MDPIKTAHQSVRAHTSSPNVMCFFAAGALRTVAGVAAVTAANCIAPRRVSGLHLTAALQNSHMSVSGGYNVKIDKSAALEPRLK